MSFFRKNKIIQIPEHFSAEDIRVESSTCTGEKTIGFYDKQAKKLVYAELVRSETDIAGFYRKYGLKWSGELK